MGGAHPSPSGLQGEVDACLGCLGLCHASVSVELQVGRFIVSLDCSEPRNVKAGEVWVNGATRARSKLARLQPLSGIHFARYTLLSRFAESIVDDQELCCAGALQNSNVPGNEGEQEPKALTKRSPCAPF